MRQHLLPLGACSRARNSLETSKTLPLSPPLSIPGRSYLNELKRFCWSLAPRSSRAILTPGAVWHSLGSAFPGLCIPWPVHSLGCPFPAIPWAVHSLPFPGPSPPQQQQHTWDIQDMGWFDVGRLGSEQKCLCFKVSTMALKKW